MSRDEFRTKIVALLDGSDPSFGGVPFERLDWAPISSFLSLFGSTSGKGREDIIGAMGDILESGLQQSPVVIAELIGLVTDLDLTQIEDAVEDAAFRYQHDADVQDAMENYRAHRALSRLLSRGV